MPGLYEVLQPLAFRLDAERVHELALQALRSGVFSGRIVRDRSLKRSAMGMTFPNPLGLAAGFDKNGVGLHVWEAFGFGFAEIGTVTMRPQVGNPKPRLWRFPEQKALVNRMGFNGLGADAVAQNFESAYAKRKPGIPIGVNLGKSKVTPLEDAPKDYAYSCRLLANYADYLVVNVSSPNTPGLRSLQAGDQLRGILEAVRAVEAQKPLLVKVAPELDENGLEEVIKVGNELGVNGYIATNTTTNLDAVGSPEGVRGGLSGAPLMAVSTASLRTMRRLAGDTPILIGVGGVMSGVDLVAKIEAGANLVQAYTGFIYGGPDFAADCLEALL